jgi:hypothetical protein
MIEIIVFLEFLKALVLLLEIINLRLTRKKIQALEAAKTNQCPECALRKLPEVSSSE